MNKMHERRFPIAPFGTRLGTRFEGKAAREQLLTALVELPQPGRLVILLDDVEVLSGSFADEAVAIPYSRLAAGEYGDRYLVLQAPSPEITDDLSHKLERRRLAALCLTDDKWSVLGLLPTMMQETLALVIERGKTTARELAEALNIRHNACLHRVSRLTQLRLIRREAVGFVGPHQSYRLFSILSP